MTDTELWSAAAGFLSSLFILPVIQQPRWSDRTRALVTLGWCVVVAAGTAYLTGQFTGVRDVRAWVGSFLAVFVTAIAAYRGFAKPSGLAPTLERVTSAPAPASGRHRAP